MAIWKASVLFTSVITALAYSMLADLDSAEDAAQEVFAIACRDLGTLKSKERFAAWLAGICRNVSRQMLKSKKGLTAENAEAAESSKFSSFSAISAASAVNPADSQDRREAIRRAVWSLRRSEREIVVLRYFDGFSQARISQVLGLSPQAVNGRLVRAKRKIAKYLKQNGFAGVDHEQS